DQALDDSSARLEKWMVAVQLWPSQQASKHEQLLRLVHTLAALPEDQRTAVELHHLKGESLTDIARMMGPSAEAAAASLSRGILALRKRLLESNHDEPGNHRA